MFNAVRNRRCEVHCAARWRSVRKSRNLRMRLTCIEALRLRTATINCRRAHTRPRVLRTGPLLLFAAPLALALLFLWPPLLFNINALAADGLLPRAIKIV